MFEYSKVVVSVSLTISALQSSITEENFKEIYNYLLTDALIEDSSEDYNQILNLISMENRCKSKEDLYNILEEVSKFELQSKSINLLIDTILENKRPMKNFISNCTSCDVIHLDQKISKAKSKIDALNLKNAKVKVSMIQEHYNN